MKTNLLIIDPQNDFCDQPNAALPVPGACADLERLSAWLARQGGQLSNVFVSLDSHPVLAVERTPFWLDQQGAEVKPFTFISAQAVRDGQFVPRFADRLEDTLAMLERTKEKGVLVWPVHCVTGTWGHSIYEPLAKALAAWEVESGALVRKEFKGQNPRTEHFGIFEANVVLRDAPETDFNVELAREVSNCDVLYIAGEASSHCVRESVLQLQRYLSSRTLVQPPRIVLLTDCMSFVPGFEIQAGEFLEAARLFGMELSTSEQQ